jgi:cyclophilin family peptidyl-prolyl cis-trans isomerase/HEAT repeat protein
MKKEPLSRGCKRSGGSNRKRNTSRLLDLRHMTKQDRRWGPSLSRALVLVAAVATCVGARAKKSVNDSATRQAIVDAEIARAPQQADLQVLIDGTQSKSPDIEALAVRALGRLERASAVPYILPLLTAPAPRVRSEAANALGQALAGPGTQDATVVMAPLVERLKAETDASVRCVIYETLGRLPYISDSDARQVEGLLVKGTAKEDGSGLLASLGAVDGLEALFRQQGKKATPQLETLNRLRDLLRESAPATADPSSEETAARVRRLSLAALIAGGGADAATIRLALQDPDTQVRRLAAVGAGSSDALARLAWTPAVDPISGSDRPPLIMEAMSDKDEMVRYDGLEAYAAHLQVGSCTPIIAATKDPSFNVALLAIDLLGKTCPDGEKSKVIETLVVFAKKLPPGAGSDWAHPSHAIVSLASVDPQEASELLAAYLLHPQWEVRMYAARAAVVLKDTATIEKLASDSDDNVRSVAVAGLSRIKGHSYDTLYIAELQRNDHQVIRLAARALSGTPEKPMAITALLACLGRLTAEKKDNTRDPRVAILQTFKDLGSPEQARDLEPYLSDFDPRIASMTADLLTTWSGSPVKATPVRPPAQAPNIAEVSKLESASVRVVMKNGGVIQLKLFPSEAPATVDRFVRLAREGYYNGLTFHRVAPNWVIQGGSPGANELVGDSPFMDDEVGLLPHVRGTLGISTRGRDAGDAQIFIDICDNFRLDHSYTVWGQVIKGMDAVDQTVEGDVISQIEITMAAGKSKSR